MLPSVRRPTIAMPVVTATAMPAGLRPMVGSRKAIWCTRKPACAVMASANGADTLQKCRLLSAEALVHFGGASGALGASSATLLSAGCGKGALSTVSASGTASTRMTAAPTSMAAAKPAAPARNTSAGTMAMPLKLAPFSARLMASPRRSLNHRPRITLMAPRLMVAHAKAMTR